MLGDVCIIRASHNKCGRLDLDDPRTNSAADNATQIRRLQKSVDYRGAVTELTVPTFQALNHVSGEVVKGQKKNVQKRKNGLVQKI